MFPESPDRLVSSLAGKPDRISALTANESQNRAPAQLPMFDYELPSLRQLPVDFPAYNAIDSVDSQNVVRLGLNNRLQTKRNGQIEDFRPQL